MVPGLETQGGGAPRSSDFRPVRQQSQRWLVVSNPNPCRMHIGYATKVAWQEMMEADLSTAIEKIQGVSDSIESTLQSRREQAESIMYEMLCRHSELCFQFSQHIESATKKVKSVDGAVPGRASDAGSLPQASLEDNQQQGVGEQQQQQHALEGEPYQIGQSGPHSDLPSVPSSPQRAVVNEKPGQVEVGKKWVPNDPEAVQGPVAIRSIRGISVKVRERVQRQMMGHLSARSALRIQGWFRSILVKSRERRLLEQGKQHQQQQDEEDEEALLEPIRAELRAVVWYHGRLKAAMIRAWRDEVERRGAVVKVIGRRYVERKRLSGKDRPKHSSYAGLDRIAVKETEGRTGVADAFSQWRAKALGLLQWMRVVARRKQGMRRTL